MSALSRTRASRSLLIHVWELSQIIDIWQEKWGLGNEREERVVDAN